MDTTNTAFTYEWLEARLTTYMKSRIYHTAHSYCDDDQKEYMQIMRIKLFELVETINAKGFTDSEALRYCKRSLTNAVIDQNRLKSSIVRQPKPTKPTSGPNPTLIQQAFCHTASNGAFNTASSSKTDVEIDESTLLSSSEDEEIASYARQQMVKQIDDLKEFIDEDKISLVYDLYIKELSPSEIIDEMNTRANKMDISARIIRRKARAGLNDISKLCKEIGLSADDSI